MSQSKTRAVVPPPKKKGFLPEQAEVKPANNMKGEKLADMTFKMPRDWHTEFKTTATLNGMNMKELLIASFDAWKRENKNK